MISLKTDSINLLYDCYIKQRSNLLWVLECKDLINIDHNLGNQLRDAVGDELLFMVLTEMSLINMVFYLKVLLMKLVDCLSIIKIRSATPNI